MKDIKRTIYVILGLIVTIPQSLEKIVGRSIKPVTLDSMANAENATTDTGGANCCIAAPTINLEEN